METLKMFRGNGQGQACSDNILTAPDDEIVCWCGHVDKRTILNAIHQGARHIDDIRRMTGACTIGRCKELSPRGRCCSIEIKKLLETTVKDREET